jgi:SAM-dependent methyltransferase
MIGSMADLTPSFRDHFSDDAVDYARHRPRYPRALGSFLAAHSPSRELAVDCGCGSGQLTELLAEEFAHVIGIDASREQIEQATARAGVTYTVARAEASGLDDHSADLIVAAQAAHWFDVDAFWIEVERLARPAALIALIAYGRLQIEEVLDTILLRFHDETLRRYWPAERWLVVDGYGAMRFPWAEITTPELAMSALWSLDDLLAYLTTWSAVKAAERSPEGSPLTALGFELAEAWGPRSQRRDVRWPLFIRAGHRKTPRVGESSSVEPNGSGEGEGHKSSSPAGLNR